jgi:hypothetical protein
MIIPIRCFTCNNVVAHLWEAYLEKIQLAHANEDIANNPKKRFVDIEQIELFEKANNTPINVYYLRKNETIGLLYTHKISSHNNIINMLLIKNNDDSNSHYVFITNPNALWKTTSNSRFNCTKCHTSFSRESAYDVHI